MGMMQAWGHEAEVIVIAKKESRTGYLNPKENFRSFENTKWV